MFIRSLAFVAFLSPVGAFAAASAETPEAALEVDLGEQATATAEPTAVPSPVPTVTVAATPVVEATPVPSAEAKDLGELRFDKGEAADGEDGLMIIAPGGTSPEETLESFGIDSPFNWKRKGKGTIDPAKGAGDDEALELSAPDSSDLKERVKVETGEGDSLPSDGDFDLVERAGMIVSASEYRVDGRLERTKEGQYFAKKGTQVALRMEPGRQVYPGSIYTVFRDGGMMSSSGEQSQEVGMFVRNVGVLKVVRIDGDDVLARIEKQYAVIREGDLVRLREPDRLRYYNSLRQGSSTADRNLKGEVLGVASPKIVAKPGDFVFLNLGRSHGVAPGLKLAVYRDAEELGRDGIRSVKVTGRVGLVEVLNTSRGSSVAKVLQSRGEMRRGDLVRYR